MIELGQSRHALIPPPSNTCARKKSGNRSVSALKLQTFAPPTRHSSDRLPGGPSWHRCGTACNSPGLGQQHFTGRDLVPEFPGGLGFIVAHGRTIAVHGRTIIVRGVVCLWGQAFQDVRR